MKKIFASIATTATVVSLNLASAVSFVIPDETGSNMHSPERLIQNLPGDAPIQLVYDVNALPLEGEAEQVPWVGGYWPKYLDSVNYRWDGANSLTAIEKYEQAFNVTDQFGESLSDKISRKMGIISKRYSYPRPKSCNKYSRYCPGSTRCAIREGEEEGICIPSWEGICHAWASAAITEPEPEHPVTVNGVTFKVNDIKALTTLMYTQGRQKNWMSYTCKKSNARGEIKYDQWGRPSANDFECADTNAGAFHVITTNLLGIHKRPFVEDRIFDEQVWNQPVRSFEIMKNIEISAEEAMRIMAENTRVGDVPAEYIFNAAAERFHFVDMKLNYIAESALTTDGNLSSQVDYYTETDRYTYLLELDIDGNIIGGEWVRRSKQHHPDFLTLTYGRSNQSMVGDIKWEDIKQMIEDSVSPQ